MFDTHTHTKNSPDSKQTIDELCCAAIERKVLGLAITDHAHLSPAHKNYFGDYDVDKCINNSIVDAKYAKEKYKDKLKIFLGVELGEMIHDINKTEEIMHLTDYDILIGSVHYVKDAKWEVPYSKIVFDNTVSDTEISELLELYFDEIGEMIEKFDFDVLAHLTGPMRYINGRYGRNIDIKNFKDSITKILKMIIERDIALEVNSAYDDDFYPNENVISEYFNLGGRLITLGSDAHRSERVANKFSEAIKMLKNIGFEYYCYYEQRKPKKIKI